MQIYVNGEQKQVPDELNMQALIHLMQLSGQRLAVEVNQELVPRSTYDRHRLHAGDRVEIVQAIGGG